MLLSLLSTGMSKRGASRQITKDDPSSDEEGYEDMEVQGESASEIALAGRQPIRVRRAQRQAWKCDSCTAQSTMITTSCNTCRAVRSGAATTAAAAASGLSCGALSSSSAAAAAPAAALPAICASNRGAPFSPGGLQLVALPQVLIQTIMQSLDLPSKLAFSSQCRTLRVTAVASPIAWQHSAPVSFSVERALSPAFSRSVFRLAPWRILRVNWCLPTRSAVETALARVARVGEVQLGEELRGNMEKRSSHHLLPQQELFWQCVRTVPALQTLQELVVCSSLAPADMCARLGHLNALHTLHVDAGYDRTGYPPEEPFSLSGVDRLPALTDLSYPEPNRSPLLLEDVARCARLERLCVLDLTG